MDHDLQEMLKSIDVQNYVVEYLVSENYVSYRFNEKPFEASKLEARFNPPGVDCFYIADSIETAKHEVKFKFDNKELYHVKPGPIFAFDAQKFANDFTLSPLLTGAQEDGGYKFCQNIASLLTGNYGLSGVAYPSRQMALDGKTGFCIALLPQKWQLDSGRLEFFYKTPSDVS